MPIICNPTGGLPEPQIVVDSQELLPRKVYSKMVIKNNKTKTQFFRNGINIFLQCLKLESFKSMFVQRVTIKALELDIE